MTERTVSAAGTAARSRWPALAALQLRLRTISPSMVALLLGMVSFALSFPGVLNPDSEDQLAEARSGDVSDWHSPLLTRVWRLMLIPNDAVWTMLALQLALFWGAAALLSASLTRLGRRGEGWAVVGVCLFPNFIFFNHYILKDTAHYSAMFFCTAVCFAAAFSEPGKAWRNVLGAAIVSLAALPVRINGAFAVAGLIVVLLLPRAKLNVVRLLLGVLFASVALILLARWVNSDVLGARDSDVIQALQIHDLMGIQYHSRDPTVWGPYALTNVEVDRCYTAYHWDTMSPTGACAALRRRIGAPDGHFFLAGAIVKRRELWLTAIRAHPLAYLEHRLRQFNSATYFIVPAYHVRFNKGIRDGRKEGTAPVTAQDIRLDYLKKNFLVWPATSLAAGFGALLLLWPRARESASAHFAVGLLASGLAYGSAYLVIGVATDVRYFLWTQLAVLLAVVVAWPDFREAWHAFPQRRHWALGCVTGVLVIGLGSRLVGVPFV